jgi:hypothetical protein
VFDEDTLRKAGGFSTLETLCKSRMRNGLPVYGTFPTSIPDYDVEFSD